MLDERTIGRVRGAEDNTYTAGVICAKVARYAERVHHPGASDQPLLRKGAKGSASLRRFPGTPRSIWWPRNSGRRAARRPAGGLALLLRRHHGPGHARRHQPLRHAKGYSGFFETICNNLAWTGYAAGTERSPYPIRAMAKSDLIVIWGTNAVNTQVNVMTHATRARKERGAKIVAVDVYMNGTMEQADAGADPSGTDGALACAVMHCLFRDDNADWDYPRTLHRRAARA